MRVIAIFLLVLAVAGCRSKRVYTEKVQQQRSDTLILKQETIKREPGRGQLVIRRICDTVTGAARPFEQVITRGGDSIRAEIVDNTFRLDWSQIDSIEFRAISEYKKTLQKENKETIREVIKYRAPGWIWYSVGLNVALILGAGYYLGRKFRLF